MAFRYAHTNIVAKDWRNLSQFYQQVFHCRPASGRRQGFEGGMDRPADRYSFRTYSGGAFASAGLRRRSIRLWRFFSYPRGIQ